MTDTARRHISIVLDRSGSMTAVKSDTEGGLAAFLAEQANAPGTTTVSLAQFDAHYERVYEGVPLADVPTFVLKPRGLTALLDAVGHALTDTAAYIDRQPEDQRPTEVTVVILTDGQDNQSTEWSENMVKAAIAARRAEGWQFVFLGADQNAFSASGAMGISPDTTMSYAGRNTSNTLRTAGTMVARGTTSGVYAFTDDERADNA